MPKFELQGTDDPRWKSLDTFVRAYVEAMFFTSIPDAETETNEDDGEEVPTYRDEYTFDNLSREALEQIEIDCMNFRDDPQVQKLIDQWDGDGESQAGHDFWLTRNGHGCGFWESEWTGVVDPQKFLDQRAKKFGEQHLYRSDDGKLHLTPLNCNRVVFDAGTIECEYVRQIWVSYDPAERDPSQWWVYSHKLNQVESHDPMDRVGGPYHISAIVDDDFDGDRWFLFAVADSYFPCHDLVRADSFEDAYEKYIDWAAEHRGIEIPPEDLKDYGDGPVDSDEFGNSFRGSYTSNGVPVDTDSIQGNEVYLKRIEM